MRSILVFLSLCLLRPAFAQQLEIVAPATSPQHAIATLEVRTDFQFVDVVIQKNIFESLPVVQVQSPAATDVLKELAAAKTDDEIRAAVEKLFDITGRSYVFTGPPGKYAISVSAFDPKYGIARKSSVITIGDGKPEPDDPKPDDPDDEKTPDDKPEPKPEPPEDKTAVELWEAALMIKSPTRQADAEQLAAVYKSVAGRAAGLSSMDAQGLLKATGAGMNRLDKDLLRRWAPWNEKFKTFVSTKVGTSKQDLIDAWLSIANALEAVR